MSKITTQAAVSYLVNECDNYVTHDLHLAYFMFEDGTLVSSNCDGIRGDDHNIILGAFDLPNTSNSWNLLHRKLRLVRLVPETGVALVTNKQRLTNKQHQVLDNSAYIVETYGD